MTLAQRLVLFVVAAAILPLVGVSFAVVATSERAIARRASEAQATAARVASEAISAELLRVQSDLGRVIDTWNPSRLSPEEMRGLLYLLTKQIPDASAAAVVDEAGNAHVWGLRGPDDPGLVPFVDHAREAHRTARWAGTAFGVFGRGESALAALREARSGAGGRWVVAVRLEPGGLRRELDEVAGGGRSAWLLDGNGGALVAAGGSPALPAAEGAALAALATTGQADGRVATPAGPALAGVAPLPAIGSWLVAVRVPAAVAFREMVALRRAVVGASAAVAVVALGLALLFARRIARRLGAVEAAARALGAGDLAVRVAEDGGDELAQVARAFNGMAGELQGARGRLERWNEELRREVEARTRDLQEAQAQLLQARKLAALGHLGGGVAHEINNPLTGILGNAQLLLELLPEGIDGRDLVEKIEALARRCRDVTQNLLRFSQQQAAPEVRDVDVNRVVREAVDLTAEQARMAGVTIALDLADPPPPVRGDAGHLGQVVLHLVSNAYAACLGRPGARIRIATRRAGPVAEIEVQDEGKGIPPENLERIFEPFFTTKDVWSNVGLGLSVAWRLVEEHGGRIDVTSRVGEGSTFVVRLPIAPAAS